MTGDRMGTFKIVWKDPKEDETVDADKFQDEGDWITFTQAAKSLGAARLQVLRIRGTDVERIERVD
jgi:hypothetical protein